MNRKGIIFFVFFSFLLSANCVFGAGELLQITSVKDQILFNPIGSPQATSVNEFTTIVVILKNVGNVSISDQLMSTTYFPQINAQNFVKQMSSAYVINGGYWSNYPGSSLMPGEEAQVWMYGYFASSGVKTINVSTPFEQKSFQVTILPDYGCYDSDNGNLNVSGWSIGPISCGGSLDCLHGTIRNWDTCHDNQKGLDEYVCINGKKSVQSINCSKYCQNGRCVDTLSNAKPNMIVESIRTEPISPKVGEQVRFFAKIKNIGDAPAIVGRGYDHTSTLWIKLETVSLNSYKMMPNNIFNYFTKYGRISCISRIGLGKERYEAGESYEEEICADTKYFTTTPAKDKLQSTLLTQSNNNINHNYLHTNESNYTDNFATFAFNDCQENWVLSNTCKNTDQFFRTYVDANNCGTRNNLPQDNGTYFGTCDFCSPSWTPFSWSSCRIDDIKIRQYYDANNCYAQTGLASDLAGDPGTQNMTCDFCTPNWQEQNSTCLANDTIISQFVDSNNCFLQTNLATDNNAPQNNIYTCDYCTPNWQPNPWSACMQNDSQTRDYYDANNCFAQTNLLIDSLGQPANDAAFCDYCTPQLANTSWSIWQNLGVCLSNDTQRQLRTKIEYDANNCNEILNYTHIQTQNIACDYCQTNWVQINNSCMPNNQIIGWFNDTNGCFAKTNLSSDNNAPANMSYVCDYCTPEIAETNWTQWTNVGVCKQDDKQSQQRSKIQFDFNFCNEVANMTIIEMQNISCDYCNPSWVEINNTCQSTDSKDGWFNDTNGCFEKTNLASDNNAPQNNIYSCDFCIPNWQPNSWSSCLINDTMTRSYSDANNCFIVTGLSSDLSGQPANDVQSCNFCSYAVTNTTWTNWQNETLCLTNDTYIQNRTKIEYDANYNSCYLATSIASDLWNNGNNKTYAEKQALSCNYCSQNWIEVNTSCSIFDSKTGYFIDSNTCFAQTNLASDLVGKPANNSYTCDYCTPNWNAGSWNSCLTNDTQTRTINDLNNCFSATGLANDLIGKPNNTQSCDFCNPSWTAQNTGCQINDQNITYYNDSNSCYMQTSLASDLATRPANITNPCNYCSPNPANTTWTNWTNNACQIGKMNQTRSRVTFDANYNTCYAVTGIASDLFANITIVQTQLIGPNLTNTSWTEWINITACLANDTVQTSRSLIQYDTLSCAANTTYYQYNMTSCDYCTPNWTASSWGACINHNQTRSYYDANNCFAQTNQSNDLIGKPANESQFCNSAPILNSISNIVVNESKVVQVIPTATDADGDILIYNYSYPLNSTGGWKTNYYSAGIYLINVTVSDGYANDTKQFTLTVNDDPGYVPMGMKLTFPKLPIYNGAEACYYSVCYYDKTFNIQYRTYLDFDLTTNITAQRCFGELNEYPNIFTNKQYKFNLTGSGTNWKANVTNIDDGLYKMNLYCYDASGKYLTEKLSWELNQTDVTTADGVVSYYENDTGYIYVMNKNLLIENYAVKPSVRLFEGVTNEFNLSGMKYYDMSDQAYHYYVDSRGRKGSDISNYSEFLNSSRVYFPNNCILTPISEYVTQWQCNSYGIYLNVSNYIPYWYDRGADYTVATRMISDSGYGYANYSNWTGKSQLSIATLLKLTNNITNIDPSKYNLSHPNPYYDGDLAKHFFSFQNTGNIPNNYTVLVKNSANYSDVKLTLHFDNIAPNQTVYYEYNFTVRANCTEQNLSTWHCGWGSDTIMRLQKDVYIYPLLGYDATWSYTQFAQAYMLRDHISYTYTPSIGLPADPYMKFKTNAKGIDAGFAWVKQKIEWNLHPDSYMGEIVIVGTADGPETDYAYLGGGYYAEMRNYNCGNSSECYIPSIDNVYYYKHYWNFYSNVCDENGGDSVYEFNATLGNHPHDTIKISATQQDLC